MSLFPYTIRTRFAHYLVFPDHFLENPPSSEVFAICIFYLWQWGHTPGTKFHVLSAAAPLWTPFVGRFPCFSAVGSKPWESGQGCWLTPPQGPSHLPSLPTNAGRETDPPFLPTSSVLACLCTCRSSAFSPHSPLLNTCLHGLQTPVTPPPLGAFSNSPLPRGRRTLLWCPQPIVCDSVVELATLYNKPMPIQTSPQLDAEFPAAKNMPY